MKGYKRRRGSAWLLEVSTGFDARSGAYRKRTETFHGTGREADERLAAMVRETELGFGLESNPKRLRLWTFIEDEYLPDKQAEGLSSVEEYRRLLGYLPDWMANAPVGSVSPAMVSRWVREMLAAGLAPSTVRLRLNRLSGVFTHAMRLRLVTFNPAAGLGPRDGDKAVAPPLEPEDAVALLGFSRGSMVEVPVALALGCGLRRGEVLGLRWADVDFEAEELHVRQALRADGAMGPPKTVAGRRTVPMPDFVVESLRGHLASQRKHRLVMGPRWSDHDLVCPTLMGGPQPVRSFWNRWEQFRQAHRLTLRFHDLRHAYATLMGESGADITDLKELMGHSRASVTMDMYQKALGRKKRRRVDAFGDLMRGE